MAKKLEKTNEEKVVETAFEVDTRLEYVIDMVESYGYSLLNSK